MGKLVKRGKYNNLFFVIVILFIFSVLLFKANAEVACGCDSYCCPCYCPDNCDQRGDKNQPPETCYTKNDQTGTSESQSIYPSLTSATYYLNQELFTESSFTDALDDNLRVCVDEKDFQRTMAVENERILLNYDNTDNLEMLPEEAQLNRVFFIVRQKSSNLDFYVYVNTEKFPEECNPALPGNCAKHFHSEDGETKIDISSYFNNLDELNNVQIQLSIERLSTDTPSEIDIECVELIIGYTVPSTQCEEQYNKFLYEAVCLGYGPEYISYECPLGCIMNEQGLGACYNDGSIFLNPYCTIIPSGQCENCVLSVYKEQNTHAAVCGIDTDYKLCCPEIQEDCSLNCDVKDTNCAAEEINMLSLYKTENSQVATPDFYENNVCCSFEGDGCSGDMECAVTDVEDCNSNFDYCIASMYKDDNTHISECTDTTYENKLCCRISE
ncbi:hypothetical protein GF327_07130 [Candidatus Woesearchaeota archaeon]|nr:hypothetical protein [Candidatus Woesearchaeota archaeon]